MSLVRLSTLKMRQIPQKLKEEMENDPYYSKAINYRRVRDMLTEKYGKYNPDRKADIGKLAL